MGIFERIQKALMDVFRDVAIVATDIKNLASKNFKAAPLLFLIPTLFVSVLACAVAKGYEPLVFDPSLYEVEQAQAQELGNVDAEALEAENATDSETTNVDELKDASAFEDLEDGTWTGFASCGVGNPDGWKPYYVSVGITVKDGKVSSLNSVSGSSTGNSGDPALSWDAAENQAYLNKALGSVRTQIQSAISSGKTLGSIDTVSGATYSSVSIYNAYVDAMSKAGGKAGAKAAAPSNDSEQELASAPKKAKAKAPATKTDKLADGTWSGYTVCGQNNPDGWKPYYVRVDVKVKKGKVSSVTKIAGTSSGEKGQKKLNWDAAENQVYLDWAIDGKTVRGKQYKGVKAQITSSIAKGKQPSSVDAVSGATYSSDAILGAYYEAIAKSAKAAGSKTVTKKAPVVIKKPDETSSSVNVPAIPVDGIDTEVNLPDGLYEGYAFCQDEDTPSAYAPYYIIVEVEVKDGRVVKITDVRGDSEGSIDPKYIYDSHENASYLNKAIKGAGIFTKGVQAQIQEYLDAGTKVQNIDTVSGATWSSLSIIEAFKNALKATSQDDENAGNIVLE